ncbi:methyltransferase domain-containing protein [uncultured Oxalicibacterium sp.]|uniref:methyltransferase domain-containing protein n=1 Tax=uncultured Oxalicibacterium sp. TaxID=1168540 RepID=UPI0025D5762E|nr:methyltransferase domain-containing protein [uncultured Oxalicibacterium sp.]
MSSDFSQPDHHDKHLSAPIDLGRVRALFSKPSVVADSAFLRREIASRMHERLAVIKLEPKQVLDAGCGEGADLSTLQKRFAQATILGIDASYPMLQEAQVVQNDGLSAVNRLLQQWLPARMGFGQDSLASLACGNFAQLPLAGNAVDMVWSNLALHWHPQPDAVFAEWRRVLRQDGLLMFSCFGPDTFKELRTAFSHDGDRHVLPFVDMHDFGDMLVNAGFSTPVMDMELLTITYGTVEKLLADVRAMGGNPLDTRLRGLQGRYAWQRVRDHLESLRRQEDGKIPLSVEVIYGHAFRPAPRVTAKGESIIRFDLPRK